MRLGFNQVKGLPQESLDKFVDRRGEGYSSVDEVVRRAGSSRKSLERLAEADAFRSLGLDRRQALWAMKGVEIAAAGVVRRAARRSPTPDVLAPLPAMPLGQHVIEDYRWTGLSLEGASAVVPARRLDPPRHRPGGRACVIAATASG